MLKPFLVAHVCNRPPDAPPHHAAAFAPARPPAAQGRASRSAGFDGIVYDPTPRRGARGAPHAVHFTLRFSAEVLPLFATSSYSTCWPSLRVDRPALSTAEIWTNTSLPPPCG